MNIKRNLITAAATGSILISMLPGAAFAADNDIVVDGNGAFSYNKTKVVTKKSKTVIQSNTLAVGTSISTKSKTGNNKSSFNVGGTSTITTGTATNTTSVNVTGGGNENTSNECGCEGNGLNTISITGNGAFSHNKVKVVDINESLVNQSNTMIVETQINSTSSTGGNSSSFNVGGGSSIETGEASTTTEVTVTGGGNTNN